MEMDLALWRARLRLDDLSMRIKGVRYQKSFNRQPQAYGFLSSFALAAADRLTVSRRRTRLSVRNKKRVRLRLTVKRDS
jgi:hypothetical protein